MANFETAFRELLILEGGYVDDPADLGGETKYGISKRAYPHVDIKNLTIEGAKDIYRRDYWDAVKCNGVLNDWVASEIFEQCVNMGSYRASCHAQQAASLLGQELTVDGIMGPNTLRAINTCKAPLMLKVLNGLQFMWYVELTNTRPEQKRFFVGWLKRIDDASRKDIQH